MGPPAYLCGSWPTFCTYQSTSPNGVLAARQFRIGHEEGVDVERIGFQIVRDARRAINGDVGKHIRDIVFGDLERGAVEGGGFVDHGVFCRG